MELKNFFAQDDQGNKLPGASCYLYQRGTESLAGLLYKANGRPLSNPFTTDANGLVQFAAANGLYDVRVISGARDYRLTLQFNDVAETVEAAEFAASRAETARDSAVLSSGVKNDTAHGLATTLDGEHFSVLGTSADDYVILYKNSAGVAVEVKRYPSVASLDAKLAVIAVSNPMVPIVADENDQVAIWLDKGKLDAKGMGPTLLQDIGLIPFEPHRTDLIPVLMDDNERVALWLDDGKLDAKGLGPVIRDDLGLGAFQPYDGSRVPVVIDQSENVGVWLDEGKLDAKALGPTLASDVQSIVNNTLAHQPVDLNQLLTTDGKSLWLYKAKRGLLKSGAPAKLKIMFAGDSWSDLDTIPNKMGELLNQDFTKIGYGWISALLNRMTNGVTASRTGWTLYDASSTPLPPEFGCAFDGGSITTNLATATVRINNLTATKIVVYYRGGPGVFRYRVDGGAWTQAPNGVAGGREKIVLDGLTDAAHLLEIDTNGNTSTVTLYGFYATRDTSGYEILKCGRGGLRGGYAVKMLPYITEYAAELEADLLIISLGTNDYRAGDVQGYIDGLTGMIGKHREARPDIGIIVIAPPDSNGVAAVPLTTIRAHGQRIASSLGCEFADIHSIFPIFAKSHSLGLWMDDLHLNVYGADILCRHIYYTLLK
ncbi:GDSL-type esterase/lipase family protein [Pseudomonas fragi]|uniref:GDSL-type esterase/lipase family protein n=1 Tax=Pseudomonas fragi TaxID=296 RepID=UPI0014756D4C|nr:hypothetical protein [Pseudomonas fragi]